MSGFTLGCWRTWRRNRACSGAGRQSELVGVRCLGPVEAGSLSSAFL